MNKQEGIELEIVKYIADSDTPLISINRLINFVLDKREEYITNNRAVPVRQHGDDEKYFLESVTGDKV